MSSIVQPALDSLDMGSRMVSLALSDLTDQDAGYRLRKGTGSSISYITGHLLYSRFALLNVVGAHQGNPYEELFGWQAESRGATEYPPVAHLRSEWDGLTPTFLGALSSLTEDQLLASPPGEFPVEDKTVRGVIVFFAWHEPYHIGQIGILRTELGYPSIAELHMEQLNPRV